MSVEKLFVCCSDFCLLTFVGWEWNLRANFRDYAHDDNVQWPNNRREKRRRESVRGSRKVYVPARTRKREKKNLCVSRKAEEKCETSGNRRSLRALLRRGEKITRIIYFLFSSHFYSFAFTLSFSFFSHCVCSKLSETFVDCDSRALDFPPIFFSDFCCVCSPFTTDEWKSWNECCETPKSLHDYSPFSLFAYYLLPRFSHPSLVWTFHGFSSPEFTSAKPSKCDRTLNMTTREREKLLTFRVTESCHRRRFFASILYRWMMSIAGEWRQRRGKLHGNFKLYVAHITSSIVESCHSPSERQRYSLRMSHKAKVTHSPSISADITFPY